MACIFLFILCSVTNIACFIYNIKELIPLNLDLSNVNQEYITEDNIVLFPSLSKVYYMKESHSNTHRIGAVSDGILQICTDCINLRTRYVFVHDTNLYKYILVVDECSNNTNNLDREILDYVKWNNRQEYEEVIRIPVELNLRLESLYYLNPFIEVFTDSDGKIVLRIPDDTSILYVIGVVKYDNVIIDNCIDGVIMKSISMKINNSCCEIDINIETFKRNGTHITARYKCTSSDVYSRLRGVIGLTDNLECNEVSRSLVEL